jgi:PTS system nitrogen regulatory IIA component
MMHFGATLRLLRLDAGVSLRALAGHVGVSTAYLSRVEHGHDPPPTPDRLAAIAEALGLPTELLFEISRQVTPLVTRYLEREPAAISLFIDVARRGLGATQLAQVKDFIDRSFPEHASGLSIAIADLVAPDRVLVDVECDAISEAIELASLRLVEPGASARALARRLVTREQEGTTAIGGGIALPHVTRAEGQTRGVLVALARPLAHDTPDGRPIDLLLVLAIAGDDALPIITRAVRVLGAGADGIRAALPHPPKVITTLRALDGAFG